jgi:hypothetical protein
MEHMENEPNIIDVKQMAYWIRRSDRFHELVVELKELFEIIELCPSDEAIDLADSVCAELEEMYANAPALD